MELSRRDFIKKMGSGVIGGALATSLPFKSYGINSSRDLFFNISLAQWSLHRSYYGNSLEAEGEKFGRALQDDPDSVLQGSLDPLYFPRVARQKFGINAVEYVNTFYFGKVKNQSYIKELKKIADKEGVSSQIIMCDSEGDLGDPDSMKRKKAVENHFKWVGMARYLGCHSIRVNAESRGSYKEQMKLAADGIRQLCEFAAPYDINILVENHGGLSSNAQWLMEVMERVDHPNAGTLPDFGNFNISEDNFYDRYKGVRELMPRAKAVSAKSYDFDERGNETTIDYIRMLKIVQEAEYSGYIGIEYEGNRLSEEEGILATKELLERAGNRLSNE